MSRIIFLALAAALVCPVAFSRAAAPRPSAALIARGHAIASKNCARCHAIGKADLSADPRSPPFRVLARKYPLSGLEEALAEGIMVGHRGPEMPHFQLNPPEIEALLAFMDSVQEK